MKAHSHAPEHQHDQPARKVARPDRAGWHDRATEHGRANGVPVRDKVVSRFSFRDVFDSALFFSFLLLYGFRERLERVLKT